MRRPRASLVIRCYNEEAHIGRLLSGVMQQTVKDVEIVVVDSGSTDATVDIAKQFPTRIVSITPDEFSFGRALNLGCAAASGELLVFASAHVYPIYRDWLEYLLDPFKDPKIALTYGKQRGDERTKFSEHRVFASWFGEQSRIPQKHAFCNNANAAIRRELWQDFRYDEELTGLEDLHWASRVQRAGHAIGYSADAVVAHVHEETWQKVYNRYRREAIALKAICPEQHFHLLDFLTLSTTSVITDWYHALCQGELLGNVRDILLFRLMQYWGAYQGFRETRQPDKALKKIFYYPRIEGQQEDKDSATCARRIAYGKDQQSPIRLAG